MLAKQGWTLDRIRGSHHVFVHPEARRDCGAGSFQGAAGFLRKVDPKTGQKGLNGGVMKVVPDGYYAAIFYEKTSKTYGVRFPDFPTIVTFGNSFPEAVEMAKEALIAMLESGFDRNQPLPVSHKPKTKRGDKVVFIPMEPDVQTAYLLRHWRQSAGLTQKQLAARMGISFQAYQRMERPGHANLTVATLQKIADALDKHLVLELMAA